MKFTCARISARKNLGLTYRMLKTMRGNKQNSESLEENVLS